MFMKAVRAIKPFLTFAAMAGLALAIFVVSAGPRAQAQEPVEGDPERGAYVFALAGGCGCHDSEAGPLAGGHEYGPFYANNLTADPETGIGNWTAQELVDAIRIGRDRDGSQLGIMPFDDYSHIADQDAYDLAAYLLSTDPIQNEVPESDTPAPSFEPEGEPPATAPTDGVARGEYIAHVAHCSHCHTPTTDADSPDMTRYMGGTMHPSWGVVPNLTPDETGLGSWSEEEIATFLRTLERPDGSIHEGTMMTGLVKGDGRYEEWHEEDALAVAAYLKTLEPVTFSPDPATVGGESTDQEDGESAGQDGGESTDPEDGGESETESEAPVATPAPTGDAGTPWLLVGGVIVLVVVGIGVAGILLRRRASP